MLRLCGQLSKKAVHLNSHKGAFCVLASFRVRSSKEAWQDRSPQERKSVLCVLGIEKLAVIKQRCIAAGAPFWIGGELPVFVVRPHAPNRDACTVTVRIHVPCNPIYIYLFFIIHLSVVNL